MNVMNDDSPAAGKRAGHDWRVGHAEGIGVPGSKSAEERAVPGGLSL